MDAKDSGYRAMWAILRELESHLKSSGIAHYGLTSTLSGGKKMKVAPEYKSELKKMVTYEVNTRLQLLPTFSLTKDTSSTSSTWHPEQQQQQR